MDVNPVSMKRVYQSIIDQFINLIKEGKLSVGEKLPPERMLADMFKVSRASIREAFRAMEIIGLIEVRPGGGTFVTGLKIANFINSIAPLFVKSESMENELLEFRKLIEVEAVKLAIEKSDEDKLSQLKDIVDRMGNAVDNNNVNLGAELDILFHKTIFVLTENYIMEKASECVSYILESSVKFNREKILKDAQNSRELFNQHTEIYNAIKQKNLQLAVEIMDKHLSFVKRIS